MQVHIVVNAEAVRAVLDEPNQAVDQITLVCPNTPERLGLRATQPLTVLDKEAVLLIACTLRKAGSTSAPELAGNGSVRARRPTPCSP